MRRRDPVKRTIYVAVALVLVMLAWSSSLQLRAMLAKSGLNALESQIKARSAQYQEVLNNKRDLQDAQVRLASLQRLGTNRMLYGTLLNAVQQSVIDDVQLVRLRSEQTYVATAPTAPKTNGNIITPGKPATIAERIQLTIDAKDSGPSPGDQVNKYRSAISTFPYFKEKMGETNEVRLASLAAPVSNPDGSYVLFTLECRYPEVVR